MQTVKSAPIEVGKFKIRYVSIFKMWHVWDEEGVLCAEFKHVRDALDYYHECEPMAAAERISELLQVSYESIFDLL